MGLRISKGDFIVYINHWLLNRPISSFKFCDYDIVPRWKFVSRHFGFRSRIFSSPRIISSYVVRGSRRPDSSIEFRNFVYGIRKYKCYYTRKQHNFPFELQKSLLLSLSTFNFFTVAGTDGTKDQRTVDDARRMNFATHEFFHRCYKFAPFVSNLLYRSRSILRSQLLSINFFFFFFYDIFYIQITKLNKADNDKITR